MIIYFLITFTVMLLFGGALVIGRLFKKSGYIHTCSGESDNCSCDR